MQDWFIHDSHDAAFRSPFGAVPCGERIVLTVKVCGENPLRQVTLCLEQEGVGREELKMDPGEQRQGERLYKVEVTAPQTPGLLWYYFRVEVAGRFFFCGNNASRHGGPSQMREEVPPSYQITVFKEGTKTPDWFKEGIIYQIFIDRFYNGTSDGRVLNPKKNSLLHAHWDNTPLYIRDMETGKVVRWDFFGGNLAGVREKLPYLKRFGITTIYFNPLFSSPSNHRYDTGDYHKIDPMVGDNEVFEALCREAAEMGISVILDGVFSHTGSDSIYFNKEGNYPSTGAYESVDSPYYKWYRFERFPDKYDSWWGIETMPNVNELEPSYQDFIINNEDSVIKYWLKKGAKGWRLDVADELPGEFIRNLRRALKEVDSDAVLIGEVWEDASNKISYGERRSYLLGEEMDSVMNYPFRNILVDFILGNKDAETARQTIMGLYENYPKQHFYANMNLLGSHDKPRILTVFEENLPPNVQKGEGRKIQKKRLQLAVLWQMTFPGTPSIYYGDEAGLTGGEDPENRRAYPWGKEDKELLSWFKEVAALRSHYDVLQTGEFVPLDTSGDVFCYLRRIEKGRDVLNQEKISNSAVVLLNRNPRESRQVNLDLSSWFDETVVDLLSDYREVPLEGGRLETVLEPLEGRLLVKDRFGDNREFTRECGILLHPTSLPSRHGIGGLGKEAYGFIDFLEKSGQKLWQVLPLNPIGYGNSPYQCYSAFAGNHLLIDPDTLGRFGLLTNDDIPEDPGLPGDKVDYDRVREYKDPLLRKAFKTFQSVETPADYREFQGEHSNWLEDYALYMALKEESGGAPWFEWEPALVAREEEALEHSRETQAAEIEYQKFLQYIVFKQWNALKEYANQKDIKIIGDLPIFVAHDSSDVWVNQHLFELDEHGKASKVAGVPPDYFSKTGQLWGNPHYKWHEMEKDDYKWWRQRYETLSRMVDVTRIDHFRGFEAYWVVAGDAETAAHGEWVKGPGEKFFKTLKEHLGPLPVIAEDLGVITPEVEDLKIRCGYPGMDIIQFALEGKPEEEYQLPLWNKNTVVYTGTHDNDTTLGWYREKYQGVKDFSGWKEEDICWYFIERAYHSNAITVVIPLQDLLALDSSARMNTPGVERGNWEWRCLDGCFTQEISERLQGLVEQYSFNRTLTGG